MNWLAAQLDACTYCPSPPPAVPTQEPAGLVSQRQAGMVLSTQQSAPIPAHVVAAMGVQPMSVAGGMVGSATQ